MGDDRLSNLALGSYYSEELNSLDLELLVNEFANTNRRIK